MSVEKKFYGYTADQKEISSYTLTNKSGMKAVLLDIGAVIESLLVPDKNGNLVDGEGNLIDWDGNRVDENGYLLNSDGSYQIDENGEYIKSTNLDSTGENYTGSASGTLPEGISDTSVPGPPEDNTDPIQDNDMESEGLTNEEAGLD